MYEKTREFVSTRYGKDFTGHGFDHINRVEKLAMHICEKEGGDKEIVQLAVLLHDYIDDKLTDELVAIDEVKSFLRNNQLDERKIEHILSIITQISYSKGLDSSLLSLEGKIVQDADRLDAIGALGICRTLTYGGAKNRVLYDPTIKPNVELKKETYRSENNTTINHFYEKLLLLKDKMNTNTAKEIAIKRHNFMVDFLDQFYNEFDGQDY